MKRGRILVLLSLIILSAILVSAEHNVTTNLGALRFTNASEDVQYKFNISVRNTDSGAGTNISQVNVTLWGNFVFIPGASNESNGTTSASTFVNDSSTLSWKNISAFGNVVEGNGSDVRYFWFNATAITPGMYNITIRTFNSTGLASTTNLSIIVNDTTPSNAPAFSDPTPLNNSVGVSSITVNLTTPTDNGVLSNVTVNLYYSNHTPVTNYTTTSNTTYTFSSLEAGTYFFNLTSADNYNNKNHSVSRTITITGDSNKFQLNGSIFDNTGTALTNCNISINVIYSTDGSPATFSPFWFTTNSTGGFSEYIPANSSWMYQITIRHRDATTNEVDYVGQNLPHFPYTMLSSGLNTNYFLKQAGTINLTAINSTMGAVSFNYQIKDTTLGYSVDGSWTTPVSSATIYLPRDKNYSIMIYPQNSIPLAFNWNNFSATQDYDLNVISKYNATTKVLDKQFNTTTNMVYVTGYINASALAISTWENFTVVPYLLEAGNMINLDRGGLPYNMSAWVRLCGAGTNPCGDTFTKTNGYYNVSIPAPDEAQEFLLLVSAINASTYYGAYRNITTSYAGGHKHLNITVYKMLGSLMYNLTLNDANDWSNKNVSTKNQLFTIVNSSTNETLTLRSSGHVEVKVNYSDYGGILFTFMTSIASSSSNFSVPLINATGTQEINIFSSDYSPRSMSAKTIAQLTENSNITMTTFSPQTLSGTSGASIELGLYKSNSTCDVPNPAASCIVQSTSANAFSPFSSIIGGGKLSFRMGIGGVLIHYVNVDLLASGPPDALFQSNNDVSESTSSGFGKAMKFGSKGPKIYDYVIMSMPYTAGSASQTGLNEDRDVNMSIPALYDENWGVVWNATTNGSSSVDLGANNSHYAEHPYEWAVLLNNTNCTKILSKFNSSNPCYIDVENNRIWMRIPQFSGTQPSLSGLVITATSTDSTSDSPGSTPTLSFWTAGTRTLNAAEVSQLESADGYITERTERQRVQFSVGSETHSVGVRQVLPDRVVVEIASTPVNVSLTKGQEAKLDVTNDGYYDIYVQLVDIIGAKAKLLIRKINEKVPAVTTTTSAISESGTQNTTTPTTTEEAGTSWWIYIILLLVIIAVIIGIGKNMQKKHYMLYGF